MQWHMENWTTLTTAYHKKNTNPGVNILSTAAFLIFGAFANLAVHQLYFVMISQLNTQMQG